MTVTDVVKNPETLTLTITNEFTATAEQVWQLWEDPAKLSQWWGPPTYPATFENFTLAPGETFGYYMTGPDGEKYHGWFGITAVDAPRSLEFNEGFAHNDGTPNNDMPPSVMRVAVEDLPDGGTRMTISTQFGSAEAMQQMVEMGMVEGMTEALGQIDALLAA